MVNYRPTRKSYTGMTLEELDNEMSKLQMQNGVKIKATQQYPRMRDGTTTGKYDATVWYDVDIDTLPKEPTNGTTQSRLTGREPNDMEEDDDDF